MRSIPRSIEQTGDEDKTRSLWADAWNNSLDRMSTPVAGQPDQDVATFEITTRLLKRVEDAALRLEVKPLDNSVIGTLAERSINAFNTSFFGTTSLIVVHSHLLIFIHLLAKAICLCISAKAPEGILQIGVKPPRKQLSEGTQRLSELLCAMRDHRDPAAALAYIAPVGWFLWHPVYSIVDCMELFVVAHEYAHLLMTKGEGIFSPEYLNATSPHDEEHSADLFAQVTVIADANPADIYLAVLSPLLLFKSLALMEQESILPPAEGHPASSQRLELLVQSLTLLATRPTPRTPLLDMVGVWSNVERLLEDAWAMAVENIRRRHSK